MEEKRETGIGEALEQAKEALREEARTARMPEAERAEYELRRREGQLNEREKQVLRRELRAAAKERLAERALPGALADALCYTDEQACMASLDGVEKAFRAAVKEGIDQRLRGRVPSAGTGASAADLTDAEYYASLEM